MFPPLRRERVGVRGPSKREETRCFPLSRRERVGVRGPSKREETRCFPLSRRERVGVRGLARGGRPRLDQLSNALPGRPRKAWRDSWSSLTSASGEGHQR